MTSGLDFRNDEDWLARGVRDLAGELQDNLASGPRVRARARRRRQYAALAVVATASGAAVAVLPAVQGGGGGSSYQAAGPIPPTAGAPGPGQAPQAFCSLDPAPGWCSPSAGSSDGPLLRAADFGVGVWGDRPISPVPAPVEFGNLLTRPDDQLEAWAGSVVGGARSVARGWAVTQAVVLYADGTAEAAFERARYGLQVEAAATDAGRVRYLVEDAAFVWVPGLPGNAGRWLGIVRHERLLAYVEIAEDGEAPVRSRLAWSPQTLGQLADTVRARLEGRSGQTFVRGELEPVGGAQPAG
ncbi:hypothetical protein [Motilibacter aurantiacus]|uniref:hypothetical protein n=1 Tax=Motilibacter aurantiacus TaxID=2714955 RepID=UPI001408BBBF|nr:hypothetical protein [Motilibacter aurantiacus]NHC43860.1 hypothetical protein [Motilibacter aurantiacus]